MAERKPVAPKRLTPEEVLALMSKEFKKKTYKMLSDESVGTVRDWVDVGNVCTNYIISGDLTKGFPFGRTVEIYGDNSTGKTLFALFCAANTLQQGGLVYYYDTECSMDKEFAQKIGVDPSQIFYDDEVETVEQFEEELESIIRLKEISGTDQPILVVLDSLALLSTAHELEEKDKNDMTKAKKLRQITRRLTRKLAKNQIGFLVLNHTTAIIGNTSPWAEKKTTTGGSAIPFLASVRLETKIFSKVKNPKTKEIDGVIIQINCKKNKITRPFRVAEIFFDYRTIFINKFSGLAEMLIKKEISKKCKVGQFGGIEILGEKIKLVEFEKWVAQGDRLDKINKMVQEFDSVDAQRAISFVDESAVEADDVDLLEDEEEDVEVSVVEAEPTED